MDGCDREVDMFKVGLKEPLQLKTLKMKERTELVTLQRMGVLHSLI